MAFDSMGLFVADPALGGAAFRVLVVGLPSNARHVQLYGDGLLIDEQDLDILAGPSTYNTAVAFENVPVLTSNNYNVAVFDGANGNLASDPLHLWQDARQYVNGNPGNPSPSQPSNPSNSTSPGTSGPSSSCSGPGQTIAREGEKFLGNDTDGSRQYNVNNAAIYQRTLVRTWTWGQATSCGYQAQDPCSWGVANNFYGRSWMVGTGPQQFGFTNDYVGCGNDWARHCFGCQPVGHSVVVSHATSFMVQPPSNLAASFSYADHLSVPTTTTQSPTLAQRLLLDTMNSLVGMLGVNLPGVSEVLDFVAPGYVDSLTSNYNEMHQSPLGQKAGGGVDVKVPTPNQKVVSGIHHWEFQGSGSFQWELQSSLYMDGAFNSCEGCGTVGNSYMVAVSHYRNAVLTLQHPQ
ncbi:MAG TPA: hypothetical protein VM241_09455 [Candidatus Thermoplasmatota archaeon]|nr:hypothetical protein [Candidatus Thermoplasmatota archaeon]